MTEICKEVEPPLVDYGHGHLAACHHPLNVDRETLAAVSGLEEPYAGLCGRGRHAPEAWKGDRARPIP